MTRLRKRSVVGTPILIWCGGISIFVFVLSVAISSSQKVMEATAVGIVCTGGLFEYECTSNEYSWSGMLGKDSCVASSSSFEAVQSMVVISLSFNFFTFVLSLIEFFLPASIPRPSLTLSVSSFVSFVASFYWLIVIFATPTTWCVFNNLTLKWLWGLYVAVINSGLLFYIVIIIARHTLKYSLY